MQMSKVDNADVYVDLGEDSAFVLSDNKKPATASIMLTLKKGEALSSQEVKAITELVAKSVSGLDPENIRIVDSEMTLYTTDSGDGLQTASSQMELTKSVQDRLQAQVVNLLSPVFGEDNVLAQVSATLNFDSSVKESVEYSTPPGSEEGIVVSMKELVEAITNDANADGSVAGIDANGNASQYLESLENSDNAVYYNVSREVNYEVNQTTTQIEEAKGKIESLSVSVILNSTNIDDYVDEVKNLVATAIGVSPESITVERLPFEAAEAAAEQSAQTAADTQAFEEKLASSEQNAQTLRIVIIAVAVLVVIIFLFSIIKMLRPQKLETAGTGRIDITLGDGDETPPPAAAETPEIKIEDKDSNLNVLDDYINKNAEAAANLLRNWLNEE
jgi:flagellar M-ring protein FliF